MTQKILFWEDIEALMQKILCFDCIGEEYLRAEVGRLGKRQKCSYCRKSRRSYSVENISNRMAAAFEDHYERTDEDGQPPDFEREGEPVTEAIQVAARIQEEVAEDIQAILEEKYSSRSSDEIGEETEFADGSYYRRKRTDDTSWREEWDNFEQSLKQDSRFFSQAATETLSAIFKNIGNLKTSEGQAVVVNAGPDTNIASFYRARTFQSAEKLENALKRPDKEIGPPPFFAANAGRMNAQGISVFYGSNDPQAALAEVRPPVGSKVVVARFDIIRPIRLLDLVAMQKVRMDGSIFDPEHAKSLAHAMFLSRLSRRITTPVLPDNETFDYLATQAVADFLATQTFCSVDGILFPSAQVAGGKLNVVLFHKAAIVEKVEFAKGAEISVSLTEQIDENEFEWSYSVFERLPPKDEVQDTTQGAKDEYEFPYTHYLAETSRLETAAPTLRLDPPSITVHHVQSVEFKTDPYSVSRYTVQRTLKDVPF